MHRSPTDDSPAARPVPRQPFAVDVHAEQDRVVVVPRGELDLGTVDQLNGEVRRLLDDGSAALVLDMRQTTFIDSTGLRLLLLLDEHARCTGCSFAIADGHGPVRRLIELTGLTDRFEYADD